MASIEPILTAAPFDGVMRTIGRVAQSTGIEAYAVGGLVRDVLLGRDTADLDFVCIGPGSGIKLARLFERPLAGMWFISMRILERPRFEFIRKTALSR